MGRTILAGVTLAALAAPLSAQTTPAPPASPPPACISDAHRAFDFWVGDWDVSPTGKATVIANSKIERLYGGCAIRENWMPLGKTGGGSLNSYDPADGRWRQVWIDSSGTRVDFIGGAVGKTMVLTGPWRGLITPGKQTLVRMTYTPNADGSVRQLGEQSEDDGKTWGPSFDFTYRPRGPTTN